MADQVIYIPVILKQLTSKSTISSTDIIALSDAAGNILYKCSIQQLVQNSGVSFSGNVAGIVKSDSTPAAGATSESQVIYFAGPGTFTNFPDENGDPVVLTEVLNIISWDGTKATVQAVPVDVDLSRYVNKDTDISGISVNLADPSKVVQNKAVNSAGNIITHAGSAYIEIDVVAGQKVNLDGTPTSSIKYAAFATADGATVVGTPTNLSALPLQGFLAPATAGKFRATIQNDTESVSDWNTTLMINIGDSILPYVSPDTQNINEIDGKKLEAETLSGSNTVPNPILAKNAVNLSFLQWYALSKQNMITVPGVNLANPAWLIPNKLVGNTGNEQSASGWGYYRVPAEYVADFVTFGGINLTTGGYASWLDASFQKVADTSVVSFVTGQTKTMPSKPAGGVYLGVDAYRPGDDPSVYANAMINLGSTLHTPYEAFKYYIVDIDGFGIGGGSSNVKSFLQLNDVPGAYAAGFVKVKDDLSGLEFASVPNPFDQILNTGSNVQFAGISIMGLKAILPSGTTRPAGVEVYDAWCFDDGTDDFQFKIRKA